MDLLTNLGLGFGVAFTWINLLYAFFGCVLGTLIGVLPGIGPVAMNDGLSVTRLASAMASSMPTTFSPPSTLCTCQP